jgi:hypothetical protein
MINMRSHVLGKFLKKFYWRCLWKLLLEIISGKQDMQSWFFSLAIVGIGYFLISHRKRTPSGCKIERDHVVIIGGSIGGMVTAAYLSKYFKRVTIVERDKLPDKPAARNGTPQSDHVHGLLLMGLNIFSEILPGLPEELVANGAVWAPIGEQLWYMEGTKKPLWKPKEGELSTLFFGRIFLEYE